MADEDIGAASLFRDGHIVFYSGPRTRGTPMSRFWSFVEPRGRCWEWRGGTQRAGYGHWQYRVTQDFSRQVGAHRFSWEMLYGQIPDGLHVLHTCDNPSCVRPSHLWLGTDQQNADDKMRKGRDNLSSRVWPKHRNGPKLSIEKAREIRALHAGGSRPADIAAQYGIVVTMVRHILAGNRWAD